MNEIEWDNIGWLVFEILKIKSIYDGKTYYYVSILCFLIKHIYGNEEMKYYKGDYSELLCFCSGNTFFTCFVIRKRRIFSLSLSVLSVKTKSITPDRFSFCNREYIE